MKLTILLLTFFPLIVICQAKYEKDTLIIEGAKYYAGYEIKLGMGSNVATKNFNFIYTSPMSIAGQTYLGKSYAGSKMTVKNIKKGGTKRTGPV